MELMYTPFQAILLPEILFSIFFPGLSEGQALRKGKILEREESNLSHQTAVYHGMTMKQIFIGLNH